MTGQQRIIGDDLSKPDEVATDLLPGKNAKRIGSPVDLARPQRRNRDLPLSTRNVRFRNSNRFG